MLTLHCVETYRRIEVLISRGDGLRFFGAGGIGAGVIRVLENALKLAETKRNESTRTEGQKAGIFNNDEWIAQAINDLGNPPENA